MGRSGRGASTSSSSSSSSIGHHDQMSMSSSTSNYNHSTSSSRFFNTDLSTDLKLGLSISPSHQRHFINLHQYHSIISNIPRDQLQASSSGHEIWASTTNPTADVGEGGSSSDHHDQYYHCNGNNNNNEEKIGSKLYVKVYMEGHPIGRKLDLLAHHGYPDLITTLDHMFHTNILWGAEVDADTCEDFHHHVLTYEDEEGDWLMVGDVPWEMFLSAVKRLKISRACPC